MKSVLRPGGTLVFDQGNSDASVGNPPRFDPVVNNRDHTRLFVIDYSGDIQTFNIFDFVHTREICDFHYTTVRIRVRLQDSWKKLLSEAGFDLVEVFGDWESTPYDKESSCRLIVVAQK